MSSVEILLNVYKVSNGFNLIWFFENLIIPYFHYKGHRIKLSLSKISSFLNFDTRKINWAYGIYPKYSDRQL